MELAVRAASTAAAAAAAAAPAGFEGLESSHRALILVGEGIAAR